MPVTGVHFRTLPFEQCVDEVAAFRNSQREAQRDAGYFRWRYSSRPNGLPAHVTLGFDETGATIAAASLIPHEFSIAGKRIAAGMIGDVSVSPTMRGRGVAAALLGELKEAAFHRGLEACFVLPNNELTGSLKRSGFEVAGEIRRSIRLLAVRGRLTRRFGRIGAIAGSALDVGLRLMNGGGTPDSRFRFETPPDFDEGYDELWSRLAKSRLALALRDRAYLHWRFRAKPASPYRIFEARRGESLEGYVVHHLEDGVVCVDDFLAVDEAAAAALGTAFAGQARDGQWGEAIQVRYVMGPKPGTAIPWSSRRYSLRADLQRVMWTASAQVPRPDCWHVTSADKDV